MKKFIYIVKKNNNTLGNFLLFCIESSYKSLINLNTKCQIDVLDPLSIFNQECVKLSDFFIYIDKIQIISDANFFNYENYADTKNEHFNYDTTLRIQGLIKEYGMFDIYRTNKQSYKKLLCELKIESNLRLVAVHLKNTSNKKNISNANQLEWLSFFKFAANNYKSYKFILISNDNVCKDISSLENITLLNSENYCTLYNNILFILNSDLFMGMMSSFGNIVIFSKISYLIFKNKLHHVEEMNNEIGSLDKYFFSTDRQFVIRKDENISLINNYFLRVSNV